jgi:hypothetical protein
MFYLRKILSAFLTRDGKAICPRHTPCVQTDSLVSCVQTDSLVVQTDSRCLSRPRIHKLMTCWHPGKRSGTSGETTGNGAGTHMYPPPPMTHMYAPPPMTTGNGAGTSGETKARRHSGIEMYNNDVARHEAHARHTPRHTPAYPRGHDSSPATLQALPKRCQCVRGGEQPPFLLFF